MKRRILGALGLIFVVSFMVGFGQIVSAFGVASDYYAGHPMEVVAGEEGVASIRLQNMVEPDDKTVSVALLSGQEVASIDEEKTYLVLSGTKDTTVPITVNVPEGTAIGTTYTVTLEILSVTDGPSGAVTLGTGVETTFDIVVVNPAPVEPESEQQIEPEAAGNAALWIVAIIVVAIVAFIIYIRRKR